MKPLTLPPARSLAVAALLAGLAAFAAAQVPVVPGKADEKKADDKAKADDKGPPPKPEALAFEAFRQNKFDEAYKHLLEYVKANPRAGNPKLILSRWLLDARQGAQARMMLEQAAAETPNQPEVYLLNASYALAEGRLTDGIMNCEKALSVRGAANLTADQQKQIETEANNGLALAYENRGDPYTAQRYLMAVKANDPKNSQVLQRLARVRFLLGDDAGTQEELRVAYKENPSLDPPELVLAQLWAQKGATNADPKKAEEEVASNRAKASEWFKKALDAYPAAKAKSSTDPAVKSVASKVARANAEWLLNQGNMEAAKEYLGTASELEPNSRDVKALQGLYHRYKGEYAEAARQLDDALRISPSFPFAMANLALALADSTNAADKQRAVEMAEQYQKQNPQNADAYAVIGYCLLSQEKLPEADQALTTALRAGQISPDTGYSIALLLYKQKQYQKADELLKKVADAKGPFVYRERVKKLQADVKKELSASAATPPEKK